MEEYKPEKNLEDKTAVDKSIEPLSTESELNIEIYNSFIFLSIFVTLSLF